MQEGLSVPAIEVNEKELAVLESASVAVMEEAQRVASAIVDQQTCLDAEKWARSHSTFARDLRKTSWLAGIRDIWHRKHDETCKLINRFADPHDAAVKRVVDPAIIKFKNIAAEKTRIENQKRFEEQKKRDEDARLARAEELAKQGKAQQADQLLSRPPAVAAPRIEPDKSVKKVWRVRQPIEGEALIELIKGIAGGAVPIKAIDVNYSFLNSQAKAMDGNLTYPGVECVIEESMNRRLSA